MSLTDVRVREILYITTALVQYVIMLTTKTDNINLKKFLSKVTLVYVMGYYLKLFLKLYNFNYNKNRLSKKPSHNGAID